VAKTDVECYRLDKASFQGLLLNRPEIAAEVSRIVGSRKSDLEQARESFACIGGDSSSEKQARLLGRIRSFFGLGR
jgi:CRP-like cAMP-binding protein